MYIGIARMLVDGLEQRLKCSLPDKDKFVDILKRLDIPYGMRSLNLPDEVQTISEDGRYHLVSMRRVLGNKRISDTRYGKLIRRGVRFYWNCVSYSSDILVRKIRANPELIELMDQSNEPFSLLGKVRTYDVDDPDGRKFCITKPLLVILEAERSDLVSSWEDRNTKYQEVFGFERLYFPKSLTKKEYLELRKSVRITSESM